MSPRAITGVKEAPKSWLNSPGAEESQSKLEHAGKSPAIIPPGVDRLVLRLTGECHKRIDAAPDVAA
jgi:hypothetical protein